MTELTTLNGPQLDILVADETGAFSRLITINLDRSFGLESSGNEIEVPDPDDPNAPAWIQFVKQKIKSTISGAGILDADADTQAFMTDWVADPDAKSVQVWLGKVGYWLGKYQLTKYDLQGKRGDKINANMDLTSDGKVTWNKNTTTTTTATTSSDTTSSTTASTTA